MFPPISKTPLLDVPVHLQDDPELCGRACAEMVLLFLTAQLFQQTVLIPAAKDPPWLTSPNQLRDLINDRLPDEFLRYRVFAEGARIDALERIWRALKNGYPAVALSDQDHWIVVHGITDGSPAVAHLRNPLPDREDVIGLPLPNHSARDQCRAKDLMNSGKPNGEVASVWSQYCLDKASKLPAGHPLKGLFIVVAPDVPRIGPPRHFHGSKEILLGSLSEKAFTRLQDSAVFEQPGWDLWASTSSNLDDAQAILVEGIRTPFPEFALVKLTNAAGGVILVNLMPLGELGAAMLEPSVQLLDTQFATIGHMREQLKIEPGAAVRPVWEYSKELFFSPFVFALEVRRPGEPRYFVRPYDGKRIKSWE